MGWFWALVSKSNAIAAPLVMLLYPLYASVMAIESPFKEDDQQWLTYWVLYSFVSLLEMAAAPVFRWIPLYSTAKLAVAAWLVLPQFRGGIILYETYVRPHFYAATGIAPESNKLSDSQRKFLGTISPDTRTLVSKYVEVHGPDAFEKLMADAVEVDRSRKQDVGVVEDPLHEE
jgi:receptor expression-enhancing protein 5/6